MISENSLEEMGGVGGSSDRKITPIRRKSIFKVCDLKSLLNIYSVIIEQLLFKRQFVQFPGSHLTVIMTEDMDASGDAPWGAFLKPPEAGCFGSSKTVSTG